MEPLAEPETTVRPKMPPTNTNGHGLHPYAVLSGGTNDQVNHDLSTHEEIPRAPHLYYMEDEAKFFNAVNSAGKTHKLFYQSYGNGPKKVFLVMGLATTAINYESVFKPLGIDRADEYTVVIGENRGVGFSERNVPGRWKTTDMARDFNQLLDHLNWNRNIHLVGTSMGGLITQEMVLAEPNRFESLALIVTLTGGLPALFPLSKELVSFGGKPNTPESMDCMMELLFPREYLEQQTAEEIVPGFTSTNRLKIARTAIHRNRFYLESGKLETKTPVHPTAFLKQFPACVTHYTSWSRLSSIKSYGLDILVVGAGKDLIVRPINSHILARHLEADFLYFDDAGHGVLDQGSESLEICKAIEATIEKAENRIKNTPAYRAVRKPHLPGLHPWVPGIGLLFVSLALLLYQSHHEAVYSLVLGFLALRLKYGGIAQQ